MINSYKIRELLFWIIFLLILSGLFFLYEFQTYGIPGEAIIIGIFYGLAISSAIFMMQKTMIPKLNVFSWNTQIIFKTFLYAGASILGYFIVFAMESYYRIPGDVLLEEAIAQFFKSMALLLAVPVSEIKLDDVLPAKLGSWFLSIMVMFFFIALVSVVISYVETRWKEERHAGELKSARLKILQAQMQPHFLFNTLNTITSLVKTHPEKAEDLLLRFSEFFRFVFSTSEKDYIELAEELKFIDNYLNLLKARFGSNLLWEINCDSKSKSAQIPLMLIQPLVENSVKHGWNDKSKKLQIKINCELENAVLRIVVSDNGNGFDINNYVRFPLKGHALYNISERLRINSTPAGLKIESAPAKGTKILLRLNYDKNHNN